MMGRPRDSHDSYRRIGNYGVTQEEKAAQINRRENESQRRGCLRQAIDSMLLTNAVSSEEERSAWRNEIRQRIGPVKISSFAGSGFDVGMKR